MVDSLIINLIFAQFSHKLYENRMNCALTVVLKLYQSNILNVITVFIWSENFTFF